MIYNNSNEYCPGEVAGDYACNNNGCGMGGNFSCIVNLIIILIVLQFLTTIINGTSCNTAGTCC